MLTSLDAQLGCAGLLLAAFAVLVLMPWAIGEVHKDIPPPASRPLGAAREFLT